MIRAVVLLIAALGLSGLATWYFGADVLVALGLILVQIKLLAKAVAGIKLPAALAWLKTHATAFFRVELIKRWVSTVFVPMVLGRTFARRIKALIRRYLSGVFGAQEALMRWYRSLGRVERVLAWAIVLCLTLALSVSAMGLWLVLFSVQLPFWLVAGATSFGRMIWASTQKSVFRLLAFLQLAWVWRLLRRALPRRWLEAKRRFEFRMARAVVRKRRLTVLQVAERKDRIPFKLGVMVEYLFLPRRLDRAPQSETPPNATEDP